MTKAFSLNLSVVVTKQGKQFIAYSPALDLSTMGKSDKDARSKFEEIVQIFMEEVGEKGTMQDVLLELGWKKVQKKWNPPQVVSTRSVGVRVPAFA